MSSVTHYPLFHNNPFLTQQHSVSAKLPQTKARNGFSFRYDVFEARQLLASALRNPELKSRGHMTAMMEVEERTNTSAVNAGKLYDIYHDPLGVACQLFGEFEAMNSEIYMARGKISDEILRVKNSVSVRPHIFQFTARLKKPGQMVADQYVETSVASLPLVVQAWLCMDRRMRYTRTTPGRQSMQCDVIDSSHSYHFNGFNLLHHTAQLLTGVLQDGDRINFSPCHETIRFNDD